ncbi:hypothetical protein [Holophaga foetida]|uniref:hypothetical protein n=1 Tax=Holophaga foetida TaxID=35839 RepID=UPI000479C599|nr:hypothetical protein [Holophaga foetida]
MAQGLERVRALARQVRRAGQHLGLDLLQLGRLSVALAKPVQLITDWLSPSPELVPKTDRTPTTGPTQPRPRLKK